LIWNFPKNGQSLIQRLDLGLSAQDRHRLVQQNRFARCMPQRIPGPHYRG